MKFQELARCCLGGKCSNGEVDDFPCAFVGVLVSEAPEDEGEFPCLVQGECLPGMHKEGEVCNAEE